DPEEGKSILLSAGKECPANGRASRGWSVSQARRGHSHTRPTRKRGRARFGDSPSLARRARVPTAAAETNYPGPCAVATLWRLLKLAGLPKDLTANDHERPVV